MNRTFGWKKDVRDERDFIHTKKMYKSYSIPDEYDLSPFLPSVRDQGSLGSCVGFGVGGNITGTAKQRAVYTEWFSPTWIYNGARLIENTLKYDEGAYPRDAFDWLRKSGCLLEHFRTYRDVLDPTDPNDWTYETKSVLPEAAKWPIVTYVRITDGVLNICDALASGHLVSIGTPWYDAWMDTDGGGYLPEDYSSVCGGHETLLYGYDRIAKVFYGQNSWGKSWGNGGRFKMPFSAIEQFLKDGGYDAHYATVDWSAVTPPEPVPEPKKNTWVFWVVVGAVALALAALLLF